ncbi:MAG: FKBP-type peptidyl-prolyl cis-trans isomerase N-terminal domain-containing protein, partial [Bacteroidota bacterium]
MKIMVFASALVFLVGACQTGKVGHAGNLSPESRMDSISYALGQDLANNLKRSDIDVNPDAFYQGLSAVINESDDRVLDDTQVQQMLALLQQQVREKAMAQQKAQQQQQKANSPVK